MSGPGVGFLFALLRAAVLLALLPVLAYSAADILLPRAVIELPAFGFVGARHIAFLIAFAGGFFLFVMSPTGKPLGPEDDFTQELEEGRRQEGEGE